MVRQRLGSLPTDVHSPVNTPDTRVTTDNGAVTQVGSSSTCLTTVASGTTPSALDTPAHGPIGSGSTTVPVRPVLPREVLPVGSPGLSGLPTLRPSTPRQPGGHALVVPTHTGTGEGHLGEKAEPKPGLPATPPSQAPLKTGRVTSLPVHRQVKVFSLRSIHL